jgi:hypothetical protein
VNLGHNYNNRYDLQQSAVDSMTSVRYLVKMAHVALAVLFCVTCYAQTAGQASPRALPPGTSLATVVHELGSDENDIERIKFLGRAPAEAARLLVLELHPVEGVRVMADEQYATRWRDTEHVVWCLRALRSLTAGMEFRAKTSHKFGDTVIERNRLQFIGGKQYAKDGTVRFFGVWMSRDSLYLAPQDAQRKIVEMWKSWYESQGNGFAYTPFKDDPDGWYL